MKTLIAIDENELNSIQEKLDLLINLIPLSGIREEKEYMGTVKAGNYLNMSSNWIREQIKTGKLKAERIGARNYKIEKSELDKLSKKGIKV